MSAQGIAHGERQSEFHTRPTLDHEHEPRTSIISIQPFGQYSVFCRALPGARIDQDIIEATQTYWRGLKIYIEEAYCKDLRGLHPSGRLRAQQVINTQAMPEGNFYYGIYHRDSWIITSPGSKIDPRDPSKPLKGMSGVDRIGSLYAAIVGGMRMVGFKHSVQSGPVLDIDLDRETLTISFETLGLNAESGSWKQVVEYNRTYFPERLEADQKDD